MRGAWAADLWHACRQAHIESREHRGFPSTFPRRARHEFDVEGQMMQSVNSSKRVLAEALATGSAVLERMGATRERLKGAQR